MSGLLADNAPNSPFTDSACCLWPVTCNQPSKVIILINDKITRVPAEENKSNPPSLRSVFHPGFAASHLKSH